MKNCIISTTIEMLKINGLKFTVDDLASSLNISKKTIYKLFDTKEELAKEVYKHIYDEVFSHTVAISGKEKITFVDIEMFLLHYMKGIYFNQESIYNRYSLVNDLKMYAEMMLKKIWELFLDVLKKSDYPTLLETKYLQDIIVGVLEKICSNQNSEIACKEFCKLIIGA